MTVLLASALALAARPAASAEPKAEPADAMARPFTVVVGLERPLFIGPYTQDGPRGEAGVSMALGPYVRSTDIENDEPFVPHAIPRLGVDLVLGDRITVGAAGGYGLSAAVTENESGLYGEHPTRTSGAFVFVGRLGYLVPMEPKAVFWPRVGLLYGAGAITYEGPPPLADTTEASMRLFAVDVDLAIAFLVARHFALVLGFSADIGLYGADAIRTTGYFAEESEVRRVHDGLGFWVGGFAFL